MTFIQILFVFYCCLKWRWLNKSSLSYEARISLGIRWKQVPPPPVSCTFQCVYLLHLHNDSVFFQNNPFLCHRLEGRKINKVCLRTKFIKWGVYWTWSWMSEWDVCVEDWGWNGVWVAFVFALIVDTHTRIFPNKRWHPRNQGPFLVSR